VTAGGRHESRPGRPRAPETDAAIYTAVLDVLADVGFDGLTYDRVAARANVSRPALYRRAASKPALVVAVFVDRFGLAPVPDTGTIAGDLTALQRGQLALYADPVIGSTILGLVAAIWNDDEARDAWVDGFVRPRRLGVHAAIDRAVARGEIEENVDAEWVCEILTRYRAKLWRRRSLWS
jgi:AcrR family transcriptional regulator